MAYTAAQNAAYEAAVEARSRREKIGINGEPGAKADLIAALESARTDFHASAALLPESERETRLVCGQWNFRDVTGHLADWDYFFLNLLQIGLHEDVPRLHFDTSGDVGNGNMAKARQHQTWVQTWTEAQTARQVFIDHVKAATEEDLNRPYTGKRRAYPTAYNCVWSAIEHYLDHAAVLRRELGVPFPEHLLEFYGPYT